MKKTVQVNLSGQVFTLDEDAYDLLTSYLSSIAKLYDRSAGKDEIIQDIEARIAELFLEKLNESKRVVDVRDVQEVVAILGKPEEFEMEAEEQEEARSQRSSSQSRNLYRDPDDRVIGGVCSGLGYYFGVNPLLFRLAFVAVLVFFGTGIILYLILWAIIPVAESTADRLKMKGEPVNIGSIGKTIEEEINALGDAMKPGNKGDRYARKVSNGIEGFFQFLTRLLIHFIRFFGKFLGVIFSFVGVICIIALIAVFLGVADAFHFSHHTWEASYSIYEFGQLIFIGSGWFSVALIAAALITICPFLLLVYGGLVLLNGDFKVPYLAGSLFVLILVGVSLSVFVAIGSARNFSKEETITESFELDELGITSDTVRLDLADDAFNIAPRRAYGANRDFMIKEDKDRILLADVRLDVVPSEDDEARLTVMKSASARYYGAAEERADSIRYLFQHSENALLFDAHLSFPKSDLYREQNVRIQLELPVGQTVYLAKGSKRVMYNIDNIHDMYDPRMIGHHWKMTSRGLACLDCEGIDPPEEEVEEAEEEPAEEEINAVETVIL